MTVIFCKLLCAFPIEPSQPVATQMPSHVGSSRVLEMPILIRIYLPQPGVAAIEAAHQALPSMQSKHTFEPLSA